MLVKKHIYIILRKKLFPDSLKKVGYIKIRFREKIRLLKFVKKKKKKKETGKFPADAPVGSRQALFPTKETLIQPMEADT